MSDIPNRRHEDVRMDKLELTVEKMQDDITYIKTKIDNGFEQSIKSTENKVNYIDKRNREEHKLLMSKLDKLMWIFLSAAVAIIIKEVVQGLL